MKKHVYRVTVQKPNGDLAYDGILREQGTDVHVTLDFSISFGAIVELVGAKNEVSLTRQFSVRLQKLVA